MIYIHVERRKEIETLKLIMVLFYLLYMATIRGDFLNVVVSLIAGVHCTVNNAKTQYFSFSTRIV